MKFDAKTLMLVASVVLNVLGGSGVVPPVVQVNKPTASPCPAAQQLDAGVVDH